VDLAIGENLSTPCTVAGIGDRGRLSNVSRFTGAGINDPGYNKKNHTSNSEEACVLHANEEKQRPCFACAPRNELRLGGNGTDGPLL
jgi:hypothetical protein